MHASSTARGSNLASRPRRTVRIVAPPFKSVRRNRALSFGTQHDRASLTRGANFILAHRRLLRRAMRYSALQGAIPHYPASVHCAHSIYSSAPRLLLTHAVDRALRSAIYAAFLSVHFALAYRAAFRRTLPRRRAQPHYLLIHRRVHSTLAGISLQLSARDNKVANRNHAKSHTNSAR